MRIHQELLLILLVTITKGADEEPCGHFEKGNVCDLQPASIISASSGLTDEVACQSSCAISNGCNFFTFFKFDSRDALCIHLSYCAVTNTTSCSADSGCVFALSGPSSHPILEASCAEFDHKECDSGENPIMTVTDVEDPSICQEICREEVSCSFFTLFINVCFLYTGCSTTSQCGLCTSGPAFPSMVSCPHDVTTPPPSQLTGALLFGGLVDNSHTADYIELVTTDLTCKADLPQIPGGTRWYAASVVFNNKILFCGGKSGSTSCDSCHSLDVALSNSSWKEEAMMTTTRSDFGMAIVGDKVYAVGGRNDDGNRLSSVESFHPERGWVLEEEMKMSKERTAHCVVAMDNSLFTISGFVSGYTSTSAMKFDLGQNSTGEWMDIAGLNVGRFHPACSVGPYQGVTGIFVSGGATMGDNGGIHGQDSVEFYITKEDRWTAIQPMKRARHEHIMVEVNGFMMVAGGWIEETVEVFNGTTWTPTADLTIRRARHSAVTVDMNTVSCEP